MPSAFVSRICAALFVFIFFSSVTAAQQPPAVNPPPPATNPGPPNPAPPKEEPDIELNTILMESTFMIQAPTPNGLTKGTVFIVARPIPDSTPPRGYLVLVTAAHVLEEIQGDVAVLNLRHRIDDKNNTWVPVPYPIPIRTNGRPLWVRHPQADVAVMYLFIPPDAPVLQFAAIPTTKLADDTMLIDNDVKPGDELRCLGYPLGYSSNDAGFPVLRSGRIASYPLLPTEKTKTFLLDFRVFKGNSGGPVYFVERYRPIPHRLGYMSYHFIVGLVSGEVLYSEQSGGQYSQELHQTQLGLANVVHASLIKQTIEMLPPPQLQSQVSPNPR